MRWNRTGHYISVLSDDTDRIVGRVICSSDEYQASTEKEGRIGYYISEPSAKRAVEAAISKQQTQSKLLS